MNPLPLKIDLNFLNILIFSISQNPLCEAPSACVSDACQDVRAWA